MMLMQFCHCNQYHFSLTSLFDFGRTDVPKLDIVTDYSCYQRNATYSCYNFHIKYNELLNYKTNNIAQSTF